MKCSTCGHDAHSKACRVRMNVGTIHETLCGCNGEDLTQDTYPMPPNGWTCFHCGETFTTPGAARDHFGATPNAEPGCLIDQVALEEGGKPERGRGLLMALRKLEVEVERLHHINEQQDNDLGMMTSRHFAWERVLLDFMRPGYTVERMIELVHANTPDHGGLVASCDKWPCTAISRREFHMFTPPDDSQVALGADRAVCILCAGWSVQVQHRLV